ncbi:ATP-dependent carboligase [Streptomyces sp. SID4926]|nr:ATP-dependent carboligase [Streptomyces sp. SID4926]
MTSPPSGTVFDGSTAGIAMSGPQAVTSRPVRGCSSTVFHRHGKYRSPAAIPGLEDAGPPRASAGSRLGTLSPPGVRA